MQADGHGVPEPRFFRKSRRIVHQTTAQIPGRRAIGARFWQANSAPAAVLHPFGRLFRPIWLTPGKPARWESRSLAGIPAALVDQHFATVLDRLSPAFGS